MSEQWHGPESQRRNQGDSEPDAVVSKNQDEVVAVDQSGESSSGPADCQAGQGSGEASQSTAASTASPAGASSGSTSAGAVSASANASASNTGSPVPDPNAKYAAPGTKFGTNGGSSSSPYAATGSGSSFWGFGATTGTDNLGSNANPAGNFGSGAHYASNANGPARSSIPSPSAGGPGAFTEGTGGMGGTGGPGGPSYPNLYAAPQSAPKPKKPKRDEQRSGPTWTGVVAALVVTCLVSVGLGVGITSLTGGGSPGASDSSPSSSTTEVQQSGTVEAVTSSGDSPDWEAVAEAVRPAVVTIQVSSGQSSSTGSGVLWDTDGNIVTNNHVVSSATSGGSIYVTLYDGRIYTASIVGTDSTTDLAVVKIDNPPDDLVAARFTTSSDLAVGQEVMAIGSPLGLTDTVTTGVISALDRPVTVTTSSTSEDTNPFSSQTAQEETVTTNAIQIDASINPGNSGGPLFDSEGAVIGINSSIASVSSSLSDSSGSIGLGFAIPVDLVKNVVAQILETGSAVHAVLGVTVSSATVEVDGATRIGAQIEGVTKGGSADSAGLQAGDVVISIDGNSVSSSSSLVGYVRRYNSGDVVLLEVVRDGNLIEVEATLQAESTE